MGLQTPSRNCACCPLMAFGGQVPRFQGHLSLLDPGSRVPHVDALTSPSHSDTPGLAPPSAGPQLSPEPPQVVHDKFLAVLPPSPHRQSVTGAPVPGRGLSPPPSSPSWRLSLGAPWREGSEGASRVCTAAAGGWAQGRGAGRAGRTGRVTGLSEGSGLRCRRCRKPGRGNRAGCSERQAARRRRR